MQLLSSIFATGLLFSSFFADARDLTPDELAKTNAGLHANFADLEKLNFTSLSLDDETMLVTRGTIASEEFDGIMFTTNFDISNEDMELLIQAKTNGRDISAIVMEGFTRAEQGKKMFQMLKEVTNFTDVDVEFSVRNFEEFVAAGQISGSTRADAIVHGIVGELAHNPHSGFEGQLRITSAEISERLAILATGYINTFLNGETISPELESQQNDFSNLCGKAFLQILK